MNIGKIFGIKINIHYSWFFIFLLLTWSLATEFFPQEYPGLANYWLLGIIASVLLFVSVLAHELSHSLVARYRKMEVHSITLFFFGGLASASEEGLNPRKEFEVAIAGPLLSIALGCFFFGLDSVINNPVTNYLFKINFLLAAFNMIPGFPLDGGRVFRAIMWKVTGDLKKATGYASLLGKAFGSFLIIWGFYSIFLGAGGIWHVLLGGFLYLLAKASNDHVVLKENLGKVKVKDVMSNEFEEVNPEESIETFVEDLGKEQKIFVVQHRGEFFVLDFERMSSIPRHQWPVALLRDVMVRVKPLRETYDAFKALLTMQHQKTNMLPVVKKEKIIGIITMEYLLKFLRS